MARLTKAILSCGEHHSPDGVLKVTPQRLQHWADTFSRMSKAGQQIPIGVDHSDKLEENVPAAKGVTAENAVGELVGFKPVNGEYAELTLAIGENQYKDLERAAKMAGKALDNVVEVSPIIFNSWKDGAGKTWTDCLTHVDLVLHPVDHNQGPFKPVKDSSGQPAIACSLRMGLDTGKPVLYRMGPIPTAAQAASYAAHKLTRRAATLSDDGSEEGGDYAMYPSINSDEAVSAARKGNSKDAVESHKAAADAHREAREAYHKKEPFSKLAIAHHEAAVAHQAAADAHSGKRMSLKPNPKKLGLNDEPLLTATDETPHDKTLKAQKASQAVGDENSEHQIHAAAAVEHSEASDSEQAAEAHRAAIDAHSEALSASETTADGIPTGAEDTSAHETAIDDHLAAAQAHTEGSMALSTSGRTRLGYYDARKSAHAASVKAHATSQETGEPSDESQDAYEHSMHDRHAKAVEKHREAAEYHRGVRNQMEKEGTPAEAEMHHAAARAHDVAGNLHEPLEHYNMALDDNDKKDDEEEEETDEPADDVEVVEEEPNPDAAEDATAAAEEQRKLEAVMSRLPQFGLALPSDTTCESLVDRLLTAMMAVESAEAKWEEENADEEPEENADSYNEASPAFAAMSLKQQREFWATRLLGIVPVVENPIQLDRVRMGTREDAHAATQKAYDATWDMGPAGEVDENFNSGPAENAFHASKDRHHASAAKAHLEQAATHHEYGQRGGTRSRRSHAAAERLHLEAANAHIHHLSEAEKSQGRLLSLNFKKAATEYNKSIQTTQLSLENDMDNPIVAKANAAHVYAETLHRNTIQQRLGDLCKTGRCTKAELDEQTALLGGIRLSLNDAGEPRKSTIERFIESREALPKGAAWKTEEKLRMGIGDTVTEADPANVIGDDFDNLTDAEKDAKSDEIVGTLYKSKQRSFGPLVPAGQAK